MSSAGYGLISAVIVLTLAQTSVAQTVYSYVNENGIRVLTNIPPKNAVVDSPTEPISLPGKAVETAPEIRAATPPGTSVKQAPRNGDGSGIFAVAATGNPAIESAATPPPKSAIKDISSRYDRIIEKYAGEYRLDPSLVRSIIATESGFNPKAVSNKGARGLMQLMPATASRLGVRNLHDAEENIKGGMKYLRTLLDTFDNDLALSLAAYNAGENLVQRIGRIPNIPETHAYVRSVQKHYGKKEMPLVLPAEEKRGPSTFRYTDENGVLHLTNIAPTQHLESTPSSWSLGGQAP